jgi:hypothetical protein
MVIKEWLMAEQVKAHETIVSLVKAALAEFDAGADIALKVKVACTSACDLQGRKVKIIDQDAVAAKEIELVTFDGAANETDEFVVKAPNKPGGYLWTAVLPGQEKEGVLHEESSAPFSFIVKPHATSMAVWDVPSPIVFNTRFKLKVGVRCSAECNLTGKEVAIYDHEGAKVATGTLGDVPWSGTSALYWAEVELEAPGTEGCYAWEAKFPKPDLELPHEGASYAFAFGTARQPEHVVTVEVLDKATNTPIRHADVILHPYRDHTDERGMARLMVPKGEYELYVSGSDRKTFQTTVKVAGDVAIKAELLVAPDLGG